MYDLNDTIVAVSSATAYKRIIIRFTGEETINKVNLFFTPKLKDDQPGIFDGKVCVNDDFEIDAVVYIFAQGRSYTGESSAEIHIWSNQCVTESVVSSFLSNGLRMAGPGEFTARAYMNGKLDLGQAEAVNKVITSNNRLQISAAQKLLAGRLTESVTRANTELIDCLSKLEAGMDFSEEDIEFISAEDAVCQLNSVKDMLENLMSGNISYEVLTDMPSVGIAGAVNAGKSSLLNALLQRERSIVSAERKTTRDILTGILKLAHNNCVLFDCAGLVSQTAGQIDELAQAAAIEALNSSEVVIVCVDISKEDLTEDASVRELINPGKLIAVATKCDLLTEDKADERFRKLKQKFGTDFLPLSSQDSFGIERLKALIDDNLLALAGDSQSQNAGVLLTARHKQSVNDGLENISQAVEEVRAGNSEVAAMMIRAAYEALATMETEHIDEKILDNIFSKFCVGK